MQERRDELLPNIPAGSLTEVCGHCAICRGGDEFQQGGNPAVSPCLYCDTVAHGLARIRGAMPPKPISGQIS